MKTFLFAILLFAPFFVSCSTSPKEQSTDGQIAVTDFRGKKITLSKPAERVVCLIESALSGIYMLQQQNKVVGAPSAVYTHQLFPYYSRLDARIMNKLLPAPGNWDFISIEQIIGLKPDLVIIWSSQTDAIETIEQFDIPVYAVMLHSFDDVFKEITDFGQLLNCRERADSLIQFTKKEMVSIAPTNRTNAPKSVYFMWSQGITETSGINSTVNELLSIAGVKNACHLSDEHVSVSIEKIYDWNPDLIVMWYNEKLDPVDIINNPLLKGLNAIKQGQVYELPEIFACDFWTLKMQYPAQLIANWAYDETSDNLQTTTLKVMYSELYADELLSE